MLSDLFLLLPDDCWFEILCYVGLRDTYSMLTGLNRKDLWISKIATLSPIEAERMVGHAMKHKRVDLLLGIIVCCPSFTKWKYLVSQFGCSNLEFLRVLFETKPETRSLLSTVGKY